MTTQKRKLRSLVVHAKEINLHPSPKDLLQQLIDRLPKLKDFDDLAFSAACVCILTCPVLSRRVGELIRAMVLNHDGLRDGWLLFPSRSCKDRAIDEMIPLPPVAQAFAASVALFARKRGIPEKWQAFFENPSKAWLRTVDRDFSHWLKAKFGVKSTTALRRLALAHALCGYPGVVLACSRGTFSSSPLRLDEIRAILEGHDIPPEARPLQFRRHRAGHRHPRSKAPSPQVTPASPTPIGDGALDPLWRAINLWAAGSARRSDVEKVIDSLLADLPLLEASSSSEEERLHHRRSLLVVQFIESFMTSRRRYRPSTLAKKLGILWESIIEAPLEIDLLRIDDGEEATEVVWDIMALHHGSPGHMRNVRSCLRQFFRFLNEVYGCPQPDWGQIRITGEPPSVQPPLITQSQIERILRSIERNPKDAPSEPLSMAVLLAYYCGLRVSEMARLTLQDLVMGVDPILVVRRTKTRSGRRRLPLAALLPKKYKSALKWYVEFRLMDQGSSAPLIPDSGGKAYSPPALSARLARACSRAGFPITAHDLRHNFASWTMLRCFAFRYRDESLMPIWEDFEHNELFGRMDVVELAQLMGHADPLVLLNVYVHTLPTIWKRISDAHCDDIRLSRSACAALLGVTPRRARSIFPSPTVSISDVAAELLSRLSPSKARAGRALRTTQ